jgi:dolichyl-phosphate beta-glucosyltransferase
VGKLVEGISIIIPAFNEEKRLPKTLHNIKDFFRYLMPSTPFEIIVLDDGSIDNTPFVALNGSAEVIPSQSNKGKGYQVIRGIMHAKYKNIIIIDADDAIPISAAYRFMWILDSKLPLAMNAIRIFNPPYPLKRRIMHHAYKLLVRLLFGKIAEDTQAPFKMLHNIDKKIFKDFKTNGFAYDVELLYRIKKAKIHIFQEKMLFSHNKTSHVSMKHTIQMLRELLRLKFGDSAFDERKQIKKMFDNKLLPFKLLDEFIEDLRSAKK